MARLSKKSASGVARDLSKTLDANATPAASAAKAKTPAPSTSKKSTVKSTLATDCHLSDVSLCTTSDDIAVVCANIVSNNLGFSDDVNDKLKVQLVSYFEPIGITSEDSLKLFAGSLWPKPSDTVEAGKDSDLLTPAVMLAINEVSRLTAVVRMDKFFLGDTTTHEDMIRYCSSQRSLRVKNNTPGSGDTFQGERKLPHFALPKFTGDRLDGSDWMKKVVRVFKNHGVALFLTDNDYPEYYEDWSTAFSARILDSLAESDIMSFLAEKYKDETNCRLVWEKVSDHLTSSDLSMTRIMRLWSEFMGLRCQDLDEFLSFYSRVTKVLDKLKETNSVAVTDDVFLRAFLAKAISCEELQTEAKKLLQDGQGTAPEILENILTDYRAQETGEELRDGKPPKKIRRVDSVPTRSTKREIEKGGLPKLPNNKGNLIPHSYYLQFKEWFEVMRIPETDRTADEADRIKSFKWKHTKPKGFDSNRQQGGRHKGGGRAYAGGGRERSSGHSRSRRARGRYRSSSSSYASDSSSEDRRRSRRGRKSRRAKRSYSRSHSRSRSPRRDTSGERSDGKDRKPSASSSKSVSRRRVMFGKKD